MGYGTNSNLPCWGRESIRFFFLLSQHAMYLAHIHIHVSGRIECHLDAHITTSAITTNSNAEIDLVFLMAHTRTKKSPPRLYFFTYVMIKLLLYHLYYKNSSQKNNYYICIKLCALILSLYLYVYD